MKTINLRINPRAFKAIIEGSKTTEIRANKKKKISKLKKGDRIVFKNYKSGQKILCKVERVTLYDTVRQLLEAEGTKHTLSSTNNLEKGIKSIHSISNYKEIIQKNGVFAIQLKLKKKLDK